MAAGTPSGRSPTIGPPGTRWTGALPIGCARTHPGMVVALVVPLVVFGAPVLFG